MLVLCIHDSTKTIANFRMKLIVQYFNCSFFCRIGIKMLRFIDSGLQRKNNKFQTYRMRQSSLFCTAAYPTGRLLELWKLWHFIILVGSLVILKMDLLFKKLLIRTLLFLIFMSTVPWFLLNIQKRTPSKQNTSFWDLYTAPWRQNTRWPWRSLMTFPLWLMKPLATLIRFELTKQVPALFCKL